MFDYLRAVVQWLTWPIRTLFYSPERLLLLPRKLLSLSLPTRVAILVTIFLLLAVVTAFVAWTYAPEATRASSWWSGDALFGLPRWLIIPTLVLIIPIVVYHALRLWLEGEVSPFPDIDYAWKAGLAELERNGLDLTQIPIFLILGSADEAEERLLLEASRLSFRVREVPQGPAPLHWYANPDGIYLLCTEAGNLSALSGLAKKSAREEADAAAVRSAARASSIRQTVTPDDDEGSQAAEAAGADIRGTMNIRGTMVIGGGMEEESVAASTEKKAVVLPAEEAALQTRRLEYVCRLLRRVRQPLCPINGLLTLLPYDLIERGPREAIQLQRAVKSDLWVIRSELKLRCPTTALVTGMESESGFRELLRRVGRDRARAQRFGKGYSLWSPPTESQLEAVAVHACGAFEDWVYSLFREKGSLEKPGNTKLYALLCKIRRDAAARLTGILRSGYAFDPQEDGEVEPVLFGGCYFAAVGESEKGQAFVKSVFDKLIEQQEELEWTRAAIVEEQRYARMANLVFGLDVLMLLALVGLLVYNRMGT